MVKDKVCACALYLHTQNISHSLCGLLLSGGSHMGVGVQGEACGEVTEHAADRLDVHTVLQCNGGEGRGI